MGYVITGGIGLAIGIGLLIWALRERSLRHDAHRSEDALRLQKANFERVALSNERLAKKANEQAAIEHDIVVKLQLQVNNLRDMLISTGDPDVIKKRIDAVTQEEYL